MSKDSPISNNVINDLTGKWMINNSNDYIVFEDTTKKMVLKTSCGIITGGFIKIDQALIFTQLNDYSENCTTSTQKLKQVLSKISYYKLNAERCLTLYDESHNEKLTLLYNK